MNNQANNLNKFYSLKGTSQESDHQLSNLGDKMAHMIIGGIGRRSKYDWDGHSPGESTTFYRNTTAEDYDKTFADKVYKTKPPYQIDTLLDFHFKAYVEKGENRETFLKHMKYVIIPLVTKMRDSEIYVTLLNEWINNKSLNRF